MTLVYTSVNENGFFLRTCYGLLSDLFTTACADFLSPTLSESWAHCVNLSAIQKYLTDLDLLNKNRNSAKTQSPSKPLSQCVWILTLLGMIGTLYLPFLHGRVLRMAGDEKVYVSQALEMEAAGRFFIQTLNQEPNYYKGPLHYLFLRLGMFLFGHHPWATLYMNLFFLALGALSLGALVRRRLPKWRGGEIALGAAFIMGIGIYAHTWTSQMEIQLAGLFAWGFYLLDQLSPKKAGFLFWAVVGLIGWSKSPLHSVFLGISAVLFWMTQNDFHKRWVRWPSWIAPLLGICICALGYLPAFWWDRENFLRDYVKRETFYKAASGQHWSVSWTSTLGFYLFPFLGLACVAYAQSLWQFSRKAQGKWLPEQKRLITLALCGFFPSALFFAIHPYHFENYNLPVISAVWIFMAVFWSQAALFPVWKKLYQMAVLLTALCLVGIVGLVAAILHHMSPLPAWWPSEVIFFLAGGTALTLGALSYGIRTFSFAWMTGGMFGFMAPLGAFLWILGERECIDIRAYLEQQKAQHKTPRLSYVNLRKNIWSEWGYLNFWLRYPVHEIHTSEALQEAIERGDTLLISSKEGNVEDFKNWIHVHQKAHLPALKWIPWKRWRTRGQSDQGEPLWKTAWKKKDLSLLEADAFLVEPYPISSKRAPPSP